MTGTAFLAGFALSASLILAIGAQNAFVLRQGLRRAHVFAICLTCTLSDAVLIAAGVAGFGALVAAAPWLEPALRYGGAAFLVVYGAMAFRAAWRGGQALEPVSGPPEPLGAALATCLALTFLNPHVYLDTLVLIGSVSTQYPGAELAFGVGAAAASAVFFFALGYGARLLAPLFARPGAWRVLEALVGTVMTGLAVKLVLFP